LPETALIAEMRESANIADTRFGCAPFARITLLPDALWQDSLTEGLLTALRPLGLTRQPEVMLDVTNIDDTVLAQVLRFLFNQAHRLSDLQLKKTDETAVRLCHITALCLPEQQASWKHSSASSRPLRTAWSPHDVWRISLPIGVRHSLWWKRRKTVCRLPCPALRSADERQIVRRVWGCCTPLAKGRPARRACWPSTMTASTTARCAAMWAKALPLIPAVCG
jgi:hypothetical protein